MAILPASSPETWTADTIHEVIHNVTAMTLEVVGVIATIFIVIGAFQYLTAFGSEEKSESGKKTLTWAIIGLVVIILARVLLGELWRFLASANTAVPF